MIIRFESQLIKTDKYVSEIFTEILNAVFNSTSPTQANRNIIRLCTRFQGPNPRKYFKWGFDHNRFWVQQRFAFQPEGLFRQRLFTVLFYTQQKLLPQGN